MTLVHYPSGDPVATTRMTLASISADERRRPMRLLVYGIDGIGKSTLAAQSESPIFIASEDGVRLLRTASGRPVPRFPQPKSWREVFEAVDTLTVERHDYRTVVLDTLDWLEPLCWAHVVANGPRTTSNGTLIESIGDIPYGNGYNLALDEWRFLCSRLEALRDAREMQVILIAHAWVRKYANPEGDDYDRFEIKLHAKAQGLLREWVDAVLFATHESYTRKAGKSERAKGISTGARILRSERTAAFDAKNRYSLPPTLPLEWSALRAAVELGVTAAPEQLRASIEARLADTAPELQQRVRAAVAGAGDDALRLARIDNHLAAQLLIAEQQRTEQPQQQTTTTTAEAP